MLKFLIDKEWENLYWILTIGSVVWVAVGVLVALDFWHGILKAKHLKEEITSEGFKRTIRKSVYYFSLLFLGGLFDFFNTLTTSFLPYPWELVPVFTVVIGLILCYTEVKSINEDADDKARRNIYKTLKTAVELKNKNGDILAILQEVLEEEKRKEEAKKKNEKN